MKLKRWLKVTACALALGGLLNGCFGSFGATRFLWQVNRDVHSNVFVQTLVMWCFTVLPVYGIFMFGDWLILNIVEFFTGSNPVGSNLNYEPGEDGTITATTEDGQNFKFTAVTDDRMIVEKDGVVVGEVNLNEDKKVTMTNYATAGVQTLDPEAMPAM